MEAHRRCVRFIVDIGRLVIWTDDTRHVVLGSGLTLEDLDKPQVRKETVTELSLYVDHL